MIQNNGILGTKQIRAVNIFINSVPELDLGPISAPYSAAL